MKGYMIVAIVLIVAGILGLVYSQFSYTEESQAAKVGPLELNIKEKHTVNVPIWASAASIGVGGAILVFTLIKR